MRVAMFLLCCAIASGEEFNFQAARIRPARNQPGEVHIDDKVFSFHSADGKMKIAITLEELREVDVANPAALRFQSYDRHVYVFRAPDAPVEKIARFLALRLPRPVVGHFVEDAMFSIPVFHKRLLGGSSGRLLIGSTSIQFVSKLPAESRTWAYGDIETVGAPERLAFRVTTARETYVLDLKAPMTDSAARLIWDKVYGAEGIK